jgi:hypothetical protein
VTDVVTMQLQGFEAFARAMHELGDDMQEDTAWRGTAAAAGVVKRKALANAESMLKRGSGALFRNFAIVKKGRNGGEFVYGVGVRHGKQRSKKWRAKNKKVRLKQRGSGVTTDYINDPYYWWMQHFGFTHVGGKRVGPHPFLSNALSSERAPALSAMSRKLETRLRKAGFQ